VKRARRSDRQIHERAVGSLSDQRRRQRSAGDGVALPANLPAEVRTVLDTTPGYARDEMREYLTHPEWDLVYWSEAYAKWLEEGKRPSQFPYVGSVGTFWRSYAGTRAAARDRYDIDAGTHIMLNVIGVSTAVEYGLKGVYEATIGRLAELTMPAGRHE
jgi:hypothetical protein